MLRLATRVTSSQNLILCVPHYVFSMSHIGQDTIFSAPSSVIRLCTFLYYHHNCSYKLFIDLFGADYLFKSKRFLLIYSLCSSIYFTKIFIKFYVGDAQAVASITGIFPCVEWYEREVWDMFGIYFLYNSDLRRILTDYGFVGHPFRKDFPLSGFISLRFDDEVRAIVYGEVRLVQEYRHFNIIMPWNYFSSISNVSVFSTSINSKC